MIGYIIIYVFIAFLTQHLTYSWIRYIDYKERRKLQRWEVCFLETNSKKYDIESITKEYDDLLRTVDKIQSKVVKNKGKSKINDEVGDDILK